MINTMRHLLLLSTAILVVAGCTTRDLRKTEEEIRKAALSHTPIGMQADLVLDFVKKSVPRDDKTVEPAYNTSAGGTRRWTIPLTEQTKGDRSRQETVGKKSINVCLGSYYGETFRWFYFKTYVYFTWCFDDSDRLIEVLVHKEGDSL